MTCSQTCRLLFGWNFLPELPSLIVYSYDGDEASAKPAASALADTRLDSPDVDKAADRGQRFEARSPSAGDRDSAPVHAESPKLEDVDLQNHNVEIGFTEFPANEMASEMPDSAEANGIGIKEDG